MSYATRYIVPLRSADGYYYRVLLKRRGYSGSTKTLTGKALRLEHGRPGEPDFTNPLPGSRLTLTIKDTDGGVFAPFAVSDDAAWQAVLERATFSDYSDADVIWQGYVLPERYTDTPYRQVGTATVVATDGWGLLANILYEPPAADYPYSLVSTDLFDALEELGFQDGIYTLMNWRPFLDTPIGATIDPLVRLLTMVELWDRPGSTRSTRLPMLQNIAARFLLSVFQSEGHWYMWQRPTLSADMSPTVWSYDDTGTLVGQEALTLIVEADSLAGYMHTPFREVLPRVRSVISTYEPYPPVDSLLVNGSFEDFVEFVGPDHWTVYSDSSIQRAGTIPISDILGASAGDAQVIRVFADASGGTLVRVALDQDLGVTIAANPLYELAVEFTSRTSNDGTGLFADVPAIVQVEVGEFNLYHFDVVAVIDALHGEKASVHIARLGDPSTNTDFVVGTEVLPVGAVLNFVTAGSDPYFDEGAQLTLSRPAAIGDSVLVGSLSANITATDRAYAHFWEHPATSLSTTRNILAYEASTEFLRTAFQVRMVTPEGEVVSGDLKTSIRMPEVTVGTPTDVAEDSVFSDIDDMVVRLSADGELLRTISWQGTIGSPAHGAQIEAGPFILGDGPTPEALSRILVLDGTIDHADTLQGGNTGWKDGAYEVAEATTGDTIDMLYARKLLLMQSEGLERLSCDLILREQDKFFPHNILSHSAVARLAAQATAGTNTLQTYVKVRAGKTVTIGAESFTVSMSAGIGPYVLTLDDVLAQTYAEGERVFYTQDMYPDYLDWDVPGGIIHFEGSELVESDQDYSIEQVIGSTE